MEDKDMSALPPAQRPALVGENGTVQEVRSAPGDQQANLIESAAPAVPAVGGLTEKWIEAKFAAIYYPPKDPGNELLQRVYPDDLMKVARAIERELLATKSAEPGQPPAMLIRAYNSGYKAGHHDTVEAQYTDIDQRDMDTYHADVVADLIADGALVVAEPTKAEGGEAVALDSFDTIRSAFDEQNVGYEFPSDDLRRGALNQFSWGWHAALKVTAAAPALPGEAAAPEQPSPVPANDVQGGFPERDLSMPAEQQGIFRKFEVRRVDGSDAPGGKHHGCRYYVLDLNHDQHAPAAMRAYAAACRATHPQLADDIEAEFGASTPSPVSASEEYANLLRIQRTEAETGDPYMLGLYNGMAMMCANFDGKVFEPFVVGRKTPVSASERVPEGWRDVVQSLIAVASHAYDLLDNSEERGPVGASETIAQGADVDALSAALDTLDELPDDKPGYTLSGPARAAWALRDFFASPVPPVPAPSNQERYAALSEVIAMCKFAKEKVATAREEACVQALLDEVNRLRAAPSTPPSTSVPLPDVLFDGKAVYDEVTAHAAQPLRTSAHNVADTLDAVVRLLRRAAPALSVTNEKGDSDA